MLITKVGLNQKSGKPYTEAPISWGITTNAAARILGCSASAARSALHRHKVPFRIVREEGQSLRLFWHKGRVQKLAERRLPVLSKKQDNLLDSTEAMRILGVVRSTLYRYERSGLLSVTKVRKPSSRGLRSCSYYRRADVIQLAEYLSHLRAKELEMRSFRQQYTPSHISPPPAAPTPRSTARHTPRQLCLHKN